jgi:hypothetical protein
MGTCMLLMLMLNYVDVKPVCGEEPVCGPGLNFIDVELCQC